MCRGTVRAGAYTHAAQRVGVGGGRGEGGAVVGHAGAASHAAQRVGVGGRRAEGRRGRGQARGRFRVVGYSFISTSTEPYPTLLQMSLARTAMRWAPTERSSILTEIDSVRSSQMPSAGRTETHLASESTE